MRYETVIEFEKIGDIGNDEGKNSVTFLAKDLQLDAEIVIKGISKSSFKNQDDYFNEARIINSSRHPNVAEIEYASQDDDFVYLAMPHYKHGSLNSVLNRGFLTVREIIKYGLEFLSGVHYIHTKKLLHFDIKPTNILINNSDVAVLTDFGLARYVDDQGLAIPDKLYNSHMPPERLQRLDLDVQSDIYQCGVTLYRMCNGNEEFKTQLRSYTDIKALAESVNKGLFPDRKNFLPHIPLQLRRVVKTALEVSVQDRYETVLQMINALSRIDANLDWRYNFDNENGTYVWSREEENTIREITMSPRREKWVIKGRSINPESGSTRAINAWCSDAELSKTEALKFVKKCIS